MNKGKIELDIIDVARLLDTYKNFSESLLSILEMACKKAREGEEKR